MERELWTVVYTALRKVARRFDQKYVQLQPWRVAAVLLWPVDHTPTLPDTGPGARRVGGSANLSKPADGSVETSAEAVKVPQPAPAK